MMILVPSVALGAALAVGASSLVQNAPDPPAASPAATAATASSAESAISVKKDGDRITISVTGEDGAPVTDLIALCRDVTGNAFTYEPADIRDARIHIDGSQTIPRSRFFAYFQDLLALENFVLIEVRSTAGDSSTRTFALRKSSGGSTASRAGYIKCQAPFVPFDRIDEHRLDSAMVFTTSIRLSNVNAQEATNTLQAYFTDPQIESVRAVTNSNALVLTGFGHTLSQMKTLIDAIDAPNARASEVLPLQHALAQEVVGAMTEQCTSQVQASQSNLPSSLQPKVTVDARSNAVLITGSPGDVERLKAIASSLDRKVDDKSDKQESRVVPIANGDAREIAVTIAGWAATSTPVIGAKSDGSPVYGAAAIGCLAHVPTNALVIRAPANRIDEVLALVKQLDQPAKK